MKPKTSDFVKPHTVEEIIYQASELNLPVEGEFAWWLWHWSTNSFTPRDVAFDTMEKCGYVPFSGYPLTKS